MAPIGGSVVLLTATEVNGIPNTRHSSQKPSTTCLERARGSLGRMQIRCPPLPPALWGRKGEAEREKLYYLKQAAASIETCYWSAMITLNNNPPPRGK